MTKSPAVTYEADSLPLFPDYRGEEKQPTRKKRPQSEIATPAFDSSPLSIFCKKLTAVYRYRKQDIILSKGLSLALRRQLGNWSGVLFEKNHPFLVIDAQSEKPEDARRKFASQSESLPKSVKHFVWTNGLEHIFLLRINDLQWKDVPDIPKCGESIKDVGNLLRRDLVTPETLLPEFTDIRNHLAANAVGVTRDEVIAREILKLLFCKIYDERKTKPDESVRFCVRLEEPAENVKERIESKLLKSLRSESFSHLIATEWGDSLELDADSISYAVGLLQHYEITAAGRDVIGQGFESLIGSALRGDEGQFFTPKNVVQMAVSMVAPKPGERVIDPACGSGGFLITASECLQTQSKKAQKSKPGVGKGDARIIGIEKDSFLSTIARAYLGVLEVGNAEVFCDDSLKPSARWKNETSSECLLGSFDVLITNPPFGAKIPVKGEQTLRQYQLGRVWRKDKDRSFTPTETLAPFRPPQILFIERCLDLLKEGGRMAIVLPDGILGNVNDGYVRQFLSERADVIAIVDCPLETFLPSTPTKTSVVVLRKKGSRKSEEYPIFLAIAEKCGHDRRGKTLIRQNGSLDDDFPLIEEAFREWKDKHNVDF